MTTCGDNGGIKRGGKPCTRNAGWGTDHPGEGRCKRHDDDQLAKVKDHKATFLEQYVTGNVTLRQAAAIAGVSEVTIWRYRREDPEFDAACDATKKLSLRQRLTNWEDSAYTRIMRGDASATLEVFWATNLARQLGSDEWLHASHVTHANDQDNPITPVFVTPDALSKEDWANRYAGAGSDEAAE